MFELYDIDYKDGSATPVSGKYQYGDLAHAKKAAAKLAGEKISWSRNPSAGAFVDAKMIWRGYVKSDYGHVELFKIFERRKNPVKNDNTLFKYTSDFLQKLRWSNKAEAKAALKMLVDYSKDFGNSAEERALYRQAATIVRRWVKDYGTDQRGRARNPHKKRAKKKVSRKKNPHDYGDRWIIAPDGDLYEVMFLQNGWHVTHVKGGVGTSVFFAGKGDGGYKAAMSHLKGMKAGRKKTKGRKKNPEIETRELSLYADNLGPSSRGIELDVYTLRKKFGHALKTDQGHGVLTNLSKHGAHAAAKAYSHTFGSGANNYREIFNDKDINDTAKYLYESWFAEYAVDKVFDKNPKKGKSPYYAIRLERTGEFFYRGRGGWAKPVKPINTYASAKAARKRIAKNLGYDESELNIVSFSSQKAFMEPRKKNPKKLWMGFKIKGKDVRFLVNRGGKFGFSLTKGEAIPYATKKAAHDAISRASNAISPAWDIGVAPLGTEAHIIWNALNTPGK